MRLSMPMLADWLKDFHPEARLQDGKRILRNARFYTPNMRMDRSTVYVGYAGDFIGGADKRIVCANEQDMLLLDSGDIGQIHNQILDAFEYYNSWSDSLGDKVKAECPLQDLLDDSRSVLNHVMMLADASYYVYAQVGVDEKAAANSELAQVQKEHIMTLDTILAINKDKRIRQSNPCSYVLKVPDSVINCSVRNLFFWGRHRGWLIVECSEAPLTQGEADLQDELGDIVERWMEYHQNQKELSEKFSVLGKILDGSCTDREDASRRMGSLNWKVSDDKQVYVLRQPDGGSPVFDALDRRLEQIGAAYALHFEENPVLVVNRALIDIPVFESALIQLLQNIDCFCGRSPVFTDIFQLRTNYELAKIAADFGTGGRTNFREIESAALPYFFALIEKNGAVDLAHPALGILREYDENHHTQLYPTLKAYLDCERNYVKAAEALFIHRNTLLYRIERMMQLTGFDLDSPDVRLHLQISFRIAGLKTYGPASETAPKALPEKTNAMETG